MMRTCFQKNASVGLGAFLILCLTVMTILAQSEYAKRTYDAARHAGAAKVLKKIMGPPDKAIDWSNKAEAIAVFPHIRSESGNNAPSLAPERIAALSSRLAVVKVSMRNMQFYPQTLKVKKGTVVEWKNDDLVPHTATSASFDSGSLGQGKSWRHTFTESGQFPYACTFHPTMTGVVIVK